MTKSEHISSRTASRKLVRAVTFLALAGQQLTAAGNASPNRHYRNRLHSLALGVRDLSLPLSRLASLLERGGER